MVVSKIIYAQRASRILFERLKLRTNESGDDKSLNSRLRVFRSLHIRPRGVGLHVSSPLRMNLHFTRLINRVLVISKTDFHSEGTTSTRGNRAGLGNNFVMDLRQATTFDPTKNHTTSFFELHSLDMFPGLGLSENDFWALFSKCAACGNYMTTRTIPYHLCPKSESSDSPDFQPAS